jgi:hypothetical protein
VKGHDFSRAEKQPEKGGATALWDSISNGTTAQLDPEI